MINSFFTLENLLLAILVFFKINYWLITGIKVNFYSIYLENRWIVFFIFLIEMLTIFIKHCLRMRIRNFFFNRFLFILVKEYRFKRYSYQ